jgi:hypothetical protein
MKIKIWGRRGSIAVSGKNTIRYGFKFVENGKSFIYLTDNEINFQHKNGLTRDEYVKIPLTATFQLKPNLK